jgi:predicted ribosome quality control (RQC) complex YloA/Tae2 family protein
MPDAKPIPFDSLNLYAVLQERDFFAGARVQDIRQPEPLTIVLHLYAQRAEHRLLISADAQFARMHTISAKLPNAPTPPPFLQSLRKHLEGGIVRSMTMLGFDRIVQAEVQTREGVYRLMIELMGKHSNIILVEPTGLVRSALKWVSPRQSEARPIRAGEPYRLPPTRVEGLLNPLTMTDDDWRTLITQMGEPRDWQAHIEGLSRFTADELEAVYRAGGVDGVVAWARRLREGAWQPVLIRDPQTRRALGAYPFPSLRFPDSGQHARTSVSLAWEQAFNERIQHARTDALRQSLLPSLRRALQARERALADLQRALHASQDADRWQLYGELILAFGHNLPAGATTLNAPDYTQPDAPEIAIPIDPSQNARRERRAVLPQGAPRPREPRRTARPPATPHRRGERTALRAAASRASRRPRRAAATARRRQSARLAARDDHPQPRQTRRERPVRRAQNPRAP